MPMPELLRRSLVAVLNICLAVTPLVNLIYFVIMSFVGWGLLSALKVRAPNRTPRGIDMLFTVVSAATVSSMSTVEMEVFSNGQLLVLTALMLFGGEVFLSLMGLAFKLVSLGARNGYERVPPIPDPVRVPPIPRPEPVRHHTNGDEPVPEPVHHHTNGDEPVPEPVHHHTNGDERVPPIDPDRRAVHSLSHVVLAIFLGVHAIGAVAVAAYIYAAPSARQTLMRKGVVVWIFALFTTVSTFSNCGFVPTNENMVVFNRDVLLQVLLVALTLAGNTLFPPLLAAFVGAARWLMERRREEDPVVITRETTGYDHLLRPLRCGMLVATVALFVAVQVVLLCAMEWDGALQGLSAWEKVVNAMFVAVNSRHTGESTIDLSTLAPAILVLFVLMMYLPSYTTWFPFGENPAEPQGATCLDRVSLSQLSCLTIAVIAVCLTERRKLEEDPLNFNVLSIVVEVVSAYGNVGFSMGYSCSRQTNPDPLCTDKWTGFVGRWSDCGKLILIGVMFFGRLKKFSMKGGKAWKLS